MESCEERPVSERLDPPAYRHIEGKVVHLYPDCPDGKIIAVGKRDAVHDVGDLWGNGLEWCSWCRYEREKEVSNGALVEVAGAIENPPEVDPGAKPETRKRRIMLVDDESGVRRALGAILTRAGYDVVLAAD